MRISGKRLRYRFEVLAELGDGAAKSHEKSLKALQDELGRWHDRHVLLHFVEKLKREAGVLFVILRKFQQILERDIDAERQKNNAAIDEILKQAEMLQLGLANYKAAVEPEDALRSQLKSSNPFQRDHLITRLRRSSNTCSIVPEASIIAKP